MLAVMSEEVPQAAKAYAELFDSKPQPIAEGLRVDTGSAPIAVAGATQLAARLKEAELPGRPGPQLAALFFRVADSGATANVLRRGGFKPVALADGSYAIGADEANGVALVFG